jgi:acid phosphatase (class A)
MKALSPLSKFLIGALVLSSGTLAWTYGSNIHAARSAVAFGYDWTSILPPPPRSGSAADEADMEIVTGFQALRDTPRWQLAQHDISFSVFDIYGSVLGPEFNGQSRPQLIPLFDYASAQLSHASRAAKASFERSRPFITAPTIKPCTDAPSQDGSYPSGHAAWGYMSSKILADLEPSRSQAIHTRGYDFGQSRIVCAVHYPSDVVAGRVMGEAVLVALQRDGEYQRLLAAARGK